MKPPIHLALSPNYRRRIKRLIQAVKNLRGISRVPGALPRPESGAFRAKKDATGKELEARRLAWEAASKGRFTRNTAHWFCQPYGS